MYFVQTRQKRDTPFGVSLFCFDVDSNRSQMQHAGGMLLPPVQTLVATIIFAHRAKMQIESTIPSAVILLHPFLMMK
jgi:hypothetical protein